MIDMCPECLTYIKARADGDMPNHRDADGQRCPGSRKPKASVKRTTPRGKSSIPDWFG